MKTLFSFSFLLLLLAQKSNAQAPVNWTKDQLLEPSELAKTLATNKNIPLIYSVGPGALIPHSVVIGMTNDEKNVEAFKKKLNNVPKDASIVVYCGCCPFEHCPNVRPAINALKELQFTNYKLLNLPHNLKADWIDKGYPLSKQ
ncbi:rhodanese-like domain-containing protein [Flavisolibacter ginsenosidimutans]|uniref:Rhodanese-like domain-containing protein n=1 Tax=Flavisolibacter ginsenosidimutans TaxID=661481 RepID=A0A5B8UNK6_9BACT|nr:rhodanese-like domain-containing protein [Flavisolibacter ginsenosidimutans]QEC58026.1 rhodanese-like domain-containing protein [Flavisolibacter ginsenosidimutans]